MVLRGQSSSGRALPRELPAFAAHGESISCSICSVCSRTVIAMPPLIFLNYIIRFFEEKYFSPEKIFQKPII